MFTLTIGNQKGGAGKTTTAANIAAVAASSGLRVLAIDMDPQKHLTESFGAIAKDGHSLGDLLDPSSHARPAFEDVVIRDVTEDFDDPAAPDGGVDLLPAAERPLERAEKAMNSDALSGLTVLRDLLSGLTEQYDLVVIDAPPRLTELTVGSLVASDGVVIPMEAKTFHYMSTSTFIAKVRQVAGSPMNPNLRLIGLLLNKYKSDAAETKIVEASIAEEGWPVLDARVPESLLASKVVLLGQDPAAVTYPFTPFAQAMKAAASEIMDHLVDGTTAQPLMVNDGESDDLDAVEAAR